MKLSVSVTNYSWPGRMDDRLATLARILDGTAIDTLWVPDHLLQADPTSRLGEPMLESYTVLGYLAAATSRLRLGAMVTAATFRAPTLLIKAVTTLDVLSRGRAWLGIGAGYNTDEARAMDCSCRRPPSGSPGWPSCCTWLVRCGPAMKPRFTASTSGWSIR